MVDVDVPDEDGPIIINADVTVRLPKGSRPAGYASVAQEISDYAREKGISRAVVKGSAVSQQGRPTLAHLESAELRGVVLSALSSVCDTETVTKASISRTFGERKADDYIADNDFWDERFDGNELRSGSREAAFCILAKCRK
ncbi:hypothetical protein [Mesorhizobium onobrychidis]|nr:hypothetical protein [Mesorhizobium onobrychidis]